MSYDKREKPSARTVQRRQAAEAPRRPVAPGKRTLTQGLRSRPAGARAPVQQRPDPAAEARRTERAARTARWMDTALRPDLHPPPVQRKRAGEQREQASPGLPASGGGRPMPAAVQAKMEGAFGADFSSVRVHESPHAAAMGALAFTQGTDIHFAPGQYAPGSQRGQELLGHELTHVVQQSQGRVRATAQAKGVALNDDASLEREADDLGARAARGERVGMAGSPGTTGGPIMQRKMSFGAGTEYLDPRSNEIDVQGYDDTLLQAIAMSPPIDVIAEKPRVGVAAYTPDTFSREGEIRVQPLPDPDLKDKTRAYTDRLIAMAHETRHGIDDLNKDVKGFRNDKAARLHTEWRAFATQSAVAFTLAESGQPVSDRFLQEMASYASKEAFMSRGSRMAQVTSSYMILYKINTSPSADDVEQFMLDHEDWVDEAIDLYRSLVPAQVDEKVSDNLRPPGTDGASWSSCLKAAGWAGGSIAVGIIAYALAKYYGLA